MAIWQWALLGLGLVWALQAVGVWFQMRHYSDVFRGIANQFSDGFVGAGHARGRFRKGAIAMVVVGPDLIVKRVLTMTGRSVFAKFERNRSLEGANFDVLKRQHAATGAGCTAAAISAAIAQIDVARRGKSDAERAVDRAAI